MFYLPFGYYYVVRLGTLPKLLSWMLIYLMPTAVYSFCTYKGGLTPFCTNYLLTLLAVFALYELGYILNDTVAIRHEEQPAIRLYEHNFRHFEKHMWLIVGVRVLYSLLALGALWWANRSWHVTDITHLRLVAGCIVLMMAVFGVYNSWRSHYNAWLYPLLVLSRYLPFMLLYRVDGWAILMLFISFPLVNMLERFSMPRYRFPIMRRLIPTEESKTLFRVIYYLIVMWAPLLLPLPITMAYVYMFPLEILCFYRLMVFFYVKRHQPKNYLNG